jgi:hypothetical protein
MVYLNLVRNDIRTGSYCRLIFMDILLFPLLLGWALLWFLVEEIGTVFVGIFSILGVFYGVIYFFKTPLSRG